MTDRLKAVSQAICERKTVKVIADQEIPLKGEGISHSELDALLDIARWAPFHQPSHGSHRDGELRDVIEPWRVYKFDLAACRAMINKISSDDNPGIIPGMLGAADALINVTWLPDPDAEYVAPAFAPTERNMEHIAAASAFIQNLLVAATARDITTYWSSGGVFKTEKYKAMLGVPQQEILLGAIFLFPGEANECEHRTGKLREKRSEADRWSRWMEL